MQFLHQNTGGGDGWFKNLILVVSRIEEETVIKLNTWEYRNISGCLEERVVRKKVNLGTLYQTRGIVC